MRSLLLAASLLLALAACQTTAPKKTTGPLDEAQSRVALFLRGLRWSDARGVSALVDVPRRKEVQDFIREEKLDQRLKVTEFELLEVTRGPEFDGATAEAELSWYLEPSVTVKKEKALIHLRWRGDAAGGWAIDSIKGGPLPLDPLPADASKPEPTPEPAVVDGGTAAPASPVVDGGAP